MLVVTLAVMVVAGEVLVTSVAPQNLSGAWFRQSPTGLVVNKSSGHSQHQLEARVVRYEFSSPGLRGPEKPAASNDVLVVGDSFTFGWLLGEGDTYVDHLQRATDAAFGPHRFRFLNGGTGAIGAADYIAWVEEFGPEIVLVFLSTDDIGRISRRRPYVFDAPAGDRIARQSIALSRLKQAMNLIPGYEWLLEHSQLFQTFRSVFLTAPPPQPVPDTSLPRIRTARTRGWQHQQSLDAVEQNRAHFRRLARWCRERGTQLWVYTTGWHQVDPETTEDEPTRMFERGAASFFAGLDVP